VQGILLLNRGGKSPMSRQQDSSQLVVLVVEDEWLLRDAIVDYLEEAGWRVLEAANGEDAISVLGRERAIDVLLTDIRLNGPINGWEVGEAFRQKHADKPVIYASGHSIEPPRQVPGSLFFDKPYRPSEILNACRRLAAAWRCRTAH
jgi:CheY-like chemotaxis protein